MLEVADKFPEEELEAFICNLVFPFEEELQQIIDKLVGVSFDIIGNLLHCKCEISILQLVPFLNKS